MLRTESGGPQTGGPARGVEPDGGGDTLEIVVGDTDVDVESERAGDLVGEEPTERPPVDAPDDFADEVAERLGVLAHDVTGREVGIHRGQRRRSSDPSR